MDKGNGVTPRTGRTHVFIVRLAAAPTSGEALELNGSAAFVDVNSLNVCKTAMIVSRVKRKTIAVYNYVENISATLYSLSGVKIRRRLFIGAPSDRSESRRAASFIRSRRYTIYPLADD